MASSANDITSTSQQYLDIHDITNDILILKDGSTSLILTVSAMNFGLLAEPEQDAIMYAYAGLLNSLNYPIQIVIRSQTKDVTSYLQLLKDEEEKSPSESKRNWISRYRQFVGELIKERNVLDKKFYVTIPASSLEMGLLPPSSVIPGVNQVDVSKVERSVILEKAREILEPKRDYLMQQFGRIGLQSRQLTTQEIIQFFYLSYNPEAAEGQQITDTNSYTTPLVQAGMQGGNMMDNVSSPQNQQSQPGQGGQQPQQQSPQTPSMPQAQPVATPPVAPVPTPNATTAQTPATAMNPAPTAAPEGINPVDVIAPAENPSANQQTGTPEVTPAESADIQNEINSTLKEISPADAAAAAASTTGTTQSGMNPTMGTPSMPAANAAGTAIPQTNVVGVGSTTPQMTGVTPVPVANSDAPSPSVPPTPSIPSPAMPAQSGQDQSGSSTGAPQNPPKPLPEI